MDIILSPQRRDEAIALERFADTIVVNGARFDLSPLDPGATLTAEAFDSLFLVGATRDEDGGLSVTVLFPHGANADEAARFPEPIRDPADGPVTLPAADWFSRGEPIIDEYGQEIAGDPVPVEPELVPRDGVIDWTRVVTPLAPPPIVLPAEVLFFERMTDDEYDTLDDSVRSGETARVYRGWAAATSFEEGSAMWAMLVKHLDLTVTAERRAELLARPVANAAMAEDVAAA